MRPGPGADEALPLPRQAVELLRELAPLTGHGVYVFPGMRDHARPMSEAAVNAALHAMDYKGRHCWHGYRASGRTILRQVLKYPADVIEALFDSEPRFARSVVASLSLRLHSLVADVEMYSLHSATERVVGHLLG